LTNLWLFECEGNSISPLTVYCLPGNTTAELILRVVEQEKLSLVAQYAYRSQYVLERELS